MHAKKKPKGKELTTAEKQENKQISEIRIKVEHAIGGMKKCCIVKERFRCHEFGFEDMITLLQNQSQNKPYNKFLLYS